MYYWTLSTYCLLSRGSDNLLLRLVLRRCEAPHYLYMTQLVTEARVTQCEALHYLHVTRTTCYWISCYSDKSAILTCICLGSFVTEVRVTQIWDIALRTCVSAYEWRGFCFWESKSSSTCRTYHWGTVGVLKLHRRRFAAELGMYLPCPADPSDHEVEEPRHHPGQYPDRDTPRQQWWDSRHPALSYHTLLSWGARWEADCSKIVIELGKTRGEIR